MARKNSNLVSVASVLNASEQTPTISQGQTVLSGLSTIDGTRVDVFKNGIKLVKDEDYTVNSNSQITMTDALDDSDHISIMSIGNPSYITKTDHSLILGTSESTPAPFVFGDPDTGLYSDSSNTLAIATGGQKRLKVSNTGTEITGHAKVGLVELADSNNVTYNISQGNIARWNRAGPTVDSNNTLTITGTSGGTLDGVGFSIMAFNGDSERNITFAGDTGITIFYGDSSTITWAGPNQHTIISGLVFDSATVILNNIAMAGSV